jgi:catechol 2,3-dioxygenase-like lactoylglutathione lyase family enzyme
MGTFKEKEDVDLKFGHIEILAADLERSKQFYCDILGFEVEVIQLEQYIWLKKGSMSILIRPGRPTQQVDRYEDAQTGFVIYTDNVHETLKALVARGLKVKGTVDSEKCFTFTDPDGNWFQLVDPHDH